MSVGLVSYPPGCRGRSYAQVALPLQGDVGVYEGDRAYPGVVGHCGDLGLYPLLRQIVPERELCPPRIRCEPVSGDPHHPFIEAEVVHKGGLASESFPNSCLADSSSHSLAI